MRLSKLDSVVEKQGGSLNLKTCLLCRGVFPNYSCPPIPLEHGGNRGRPVAKLAYGFCLGTRKMGNVQRNLKNVKAQILTLNLTFIVFRSKSQQTA